MNVIKRFKKKICNRWLAFCWHYTNKAKFIMEWKKNDTVRLTCYSSKSKNDNEKIEADALSKAIVAIVKELKAGADNPTEEEILEPFKIAVAQEFGITKEEYYQRKRKDGV